MDIIGLNLIDNVSLVSTVCHYNITQLISRPHFTTV